MSLIYKFVEVSIVSDDMIEKCVNQWVSAGWQFDDIRFVTGNASRRPVMAFVSFVRDDFAVEKTARAATAVGEEPGLDARFEGQSARADALVAHAGGMADQQGRSASAGGPSPVVRSRNALAALIERDEES